MLKSLVCFGLSALLSASIIAGMQRGPAAGRASEIFYRASPKTSTPAAPPRTSTPSTPPRGTPPTITAGAGKATTPDVRPPAPDVPAPQVQTVAYTPLGMRYSLLRRIAQGQYSEVDPEMVFRSGDGLRVSVESNDGAYLYIVALGSSGSWSVLFPNAQTNSGDNRVEARRRYEIPAGGQFTFDQQPGTERLFVVLSRTQQSDLESLIYSLDRRSTPAPQTQPLRTLAQNIPVPDALVGRIRDQFVSRDLVFEKVDEASSDRKEKAMYVVNANATADSRVIVDLSLKHQ